MARPKTKLLALVTIAASLTCASAANAAGSIAQDGSRRNTQGAQADSSPPPADPNMAPYPDCEVLLRIKPGACDPDQPIQLDITGEADITAQVDQVQAALDKEIGLDGGLEWVHDRKVLLVRLVGPIDGSSPAVEHAKAAALAVGKGLTIEFQSVKYSRAELEALDNKLLPTQREWAPGGVPRASGGWDAGKNRVVLLVPNDTGDTAAWTDRVKALQDDRVLLEFYTPTPGHADFEEQVSRIGDISPWNGGDWLNSQNIAPNTSGNAQCTSGFSWRQWSTGYYRGSTANHCSGVGWFHNGLVWGIPDPDGRSAAADTQLIKQVSGNYNFYPAVWVGNQTTTVSRVVRAIKSTPAVGNTVAMSGANSGLQTGQIVDLSYYVAQIDANVVLMNTTACLSGDSGAPWLTTMGPNSAYPGSVVAWGQHRGESFVAGHEGCGWTPVNYISSYVHASIQLTY